MPDKITVVIVAIPDAMVSTITGLYDVLTGFDLLGHYDGVPTEPPFEVSIVAPSSGQTDTASGLPLTAHASINEISRADIVIVPSLRVSDGRWIPGRYPEVVDWLSELHHSGALLGSACSGVLLLAETGLLDGLDATLHWAYADTFRANFPAIKLRLEEVLVTTGDQEEFIMSGGSASWHDLVLYLVARLVGPTSAQAIANFMLLQWHTDGQSPYVAFAPPTDHRDAAILELQQWLEDAYETPNPVQEMIARSGLADRTFNRRFSKATGFTPISYVQHLRVEHAKRLLERTDLPTDRVCFEIGYLEPASFRRLFKRITNLTPAEYRRRFRVPEVLPRR